MKDIAEAKSILFIWATFPKLKECLKVMEAWGFKYYGLGFDWTKTGKNGKPCYGMGYYTMLKNEIYVGDKHFGKRPSKNVVTGEEDEDQFEAYFKDHHKAIVDRETWERCQERMAAEREKKKKGGRTPIVDGEGVW